MLLQFYEKEGLENFGANLQMQHQIFSFFLTRIFEFFHTRSKPVYARFTPSHAMGELSKKIGRSLQVFDQFDLFTVFLF